MQNGIPQGSPISVILFLIAFNRLYCLIPFNRSISLSAYADDLNIIVKSNERNPVLQLNSLFDDINVWCQFSGASLSRTKCKYIHICRKRNCRCIIQSSYFNITEVSTLKLLGLYINKRYNWKDHINFLILSLTKRLNVIKCLSSFKFNCSPKTLISTVRTIILSKLNYLLPIYGFAPKSDLRKLDAIINSGIRSALGAFRTTPTGNLLYESNILPLSTQRDILTAKLFRTITYDSSSPLRQLAVKLIQARKIPKIPSVLYRIIQKSCTLNIPLKTTFPKRMNHPTWDLNTSIFDITMAKFGKTHTSAFQFKSFFNEIKRKLTSHRFIFTDGSKMDNSVSFSITTENKVISQFLLPTYTSIYTAELIAIYEAIQYIQSKSGKFVICTDSLSSIKSIMNISNDNTYVSQIRNILIDKYPDILLLWVPSHCGITGNEFADVTAKSAEKSPIHTHSNFDKHDLNKFITTHFNIVDRNLTFDRTSTWYKKINCNRVTINELTTSNTNRLEVAKFTRLRLGHTKLTHGHLLNIDVPNYCNCTPDYTNVFHFLLDCPKFNSIRRQIFQNTDPTLYLSYPSQKNIQIINHFLKETNLFNKI